MILFYNCMADVRRQFEQCTFIPLTWHDACVCACVCMDELGRRRIEERRKKRKKNNGAITSKWFFSYSFIRMFIHSFIGITFPVYRLARNDTTFTITCNDTAVFAFYLWINSKSSKCFLFRCRTNKSSAFIQKWLISCTSWNWCEFCAVLWFECDQCVCVCERRQTRRIAIAAIR